MFKQNEFKKNMENITAIFGFNLQPLISGIGLGLCLSIYIYMFCS